MTDAQKLITVKTLLDDGGEMPSDEKLNTYIALAGNEILAWKYHLINGVPANVTAVPTVDEGAQIYAVIAGYTHAGAESESRHSENSVVREYIYGDMIDYIRDHVLPYVRVGSLKN